MHEKIKNQIKEAMRAKDTVRLEVLRGLSALFTNEIIATKKAKFKKAADGSDLLPDENVITIIRRSVKQRKDSIEQFAQGGRKDLVKKETAELVILESFLTKMMSQAEIEKFVKAKLSGAGGAKPTKIDKAKIGQFIGLIMKELKGKADGADVKVVVEKLGQK